MKLFKKIDFWIQLVLITGSLVFVAIDLPNFIVCYFVIGGWQIFSCIIHVFLQGQFIAHRWRLLYCRALLMLGVSAVLFYAMGVFILLLIILVFLPPVLACCYAFICREENHLLARKDFIHLK
ncbi:MAG: hypothetical protein ABW007_08220 [Chitinophagaceae bacterium]